MHKCEKVDLFVMLIKMHDWREDMLMGGCIKGVRKEELVSCINELWMYNNGS